MPNKDDSLHNMRISENGISLPKWMMIAVVIGAFSLGSAQAGVGFWVNSLDQRIAKHEIEMEEHRHSEGHPVLMQKVLNLQNEMERMETREAARWAAVEKLTEKLDKMNQNIIKLCARSRAGCRE